MRGKQEDHQQNDVEDQPANRRHRSLTLARAGGCAIDQEAEAEATGERAGRAL